MSLEFDMSFEDSHGQPVEIAPGLMRLTANNPSPFTFRGTNSYVVGTDTLAVIDPGPAGDERHLDALMAAIAGRPVSHIVVTHSHADHSPLAAPLKAATGAEIWAEGPNRTARPLTGDGEAQLEAGGDAGFAPDRPVGEGEVIEGDGWRLETVLTPGHAANHACFALSGTGYLFSGDHVMGWSTTVVSPPGGSMADYMASLDRLIAREDRILLPGHGNPVTNPQAFMRGLRTHRRMREMAILDRIRKGDRRIAEMVAAIYRDIDPRLHRGAAFSVLAHLEMLVADGRVRAQGVPSLDAIYEPA
jgi:glyoxylase-like metal-dependent hydrolase (beta-lactamase superfamily II)